MPELVSRVDGGLPTFPAGAGKGAVFSPLPQDTDKGRMRAHAVQTILADPQMLYELWRAVSIAPRWMEFVVEATATSPTVTHWVMGDPADPKGPRVEWDTEFVADEPGKRIAWRSITPGIDEAGEVQFNQRENGRGTEVVLLESMTIPGGKLGIAAAAFTRRSPRQIVIEDLRHFKQLAETGEIPNVSRNTHGPRGFVGSFKERMYGENNPTPPGTSVLPTAEAPAKK